MSDSLLSLRPELDAAVEQALTTAARHGASAAEASVSVDAGLSVNVRLGEVERLEHHRDRGLGVTVYFGGRKGSASSSDLSPKAIDEVVEAACNIARHTSEDEYAGLPPIDRLAQETLDLDLYHRWSISVEDAIALAQSCEAVARGLDPRISNSDGASVDLHHGVSVLGNSLGFLGGYAGSRHSLSCAVLAADEGGMQSDYSYSTARDPLELEQAERVGRQAAERALSRLGARKLTTRSAPAIYQAEEARGLLGHLISAVRGTAQYRRSSFLLEAIGEQLFPQWVQIREQPHLLKALGSAPFDGEGVATGPRDLVADGVLKGYVLDSYSARRLGMESTGNAGGVHNLTIASTGESFEQLLTKMGEGLLVTDLMGHGINGVTGDYSRGAAGFWVEGGEIAYPVEEITVAGNLKQMYRSLTAVGEDEDRRGSIRTGSWLLDEVTIAGE